MFGKKRFILVAVMAVVVFTLTSCGGAYVNNETTAVSAETVAVQLQYVDGAEVGPLYDVQVAVPAEWVGKFETRNVGNRLYFDYVGDSGDAAEIFFIEALSTSQYWDQNGAHPSSYTNIVNRGNTYFIYYLPIDAYYSGLSDEDFATLAEAVPAIVASFSASVVN